MTYYEFFRQIVVLVGVGVIVYYALIITTAIVIRILAKIRERKANRQKDSSSE